MSRYLTAIGETSSEYTEKRSRFIATLRHCDNEAEALAFIEEMRSKYWDAKHNVFAYSIKNGKVIRFSDDGEPHGTAGKPILDIINGSGITDIAIVVTRYFGGILLGTGGLVRAYSKSAKDAIDNADIAEMIACTVFETECEYSDHAKLVSLMEKTGANIDDSIFSDKVKLIYFIKDKDTNEFIHKLSESFSARLYAKEIEKIIIPVKLEKNL